MLAITTHQPQNKVYNPLACIMQEIINKTYNEFATTTSACGRQVDIGFRLFN